MKAEFDSGGRGAASLSNPWPATINASGCVSHVTSQNVRWQTCYIRYALADNDPGFWYRAFTLQGSGRGHGPSGWVLTRGRSIAQFTGTGLLIVERNPLSTIQGNNCSTDTIGISIFAELSRSYSRCDDEFRPIFPLLNKKFGVRHDTFSKGPCDPRGSAAALILRIKNGNGYSQSFVASVHEANAGWVGDC